MLVYVWLKTVHWGGVKLTFRISFCFKKIVKYHEFVGNIVVRSTLFCIITCVVAVEEIIQPDTESR